LAGTTQPIGVWCLGLLWMPGPAAKL